MMNKVILMGRVGQDPELKDAGGAKVVNLGLATTEVWKDRDGNKQEATEWHRLQIWERQAEIVAEYVGKGDLLTVEGKLKSREYDDKDGVTRRITEVRVERVILMPKSKSGDDSEKKEKKDRGDEIMDDVRREQTRRRAEKPAEEAVEFNDDLPF